jgi:SAM-dependent methyltransferase
MTRNGAEDNRLQPVDRAAHDWYRFVLSFPPHLVRTYLDRFGVTAGQCVLDPFCGTGTTLVECKKLGIASVGIERNPMAHFASRTKIDWSVNPDRLIAHAEEVAARAAVRLRIDGVSDEAKPTSASNGATVAGPLRTLPPEARAILLKNSISELPLHKVLVLLEALTSDERCEFSGPERLALAQVIVKQASNLHFGPEVGVGPLDAEMPVDAGMPVIAPWVKAIHSIARDLRQLRDHASTPAVVHLTDARHLTEVIAPASIDAVITSPPYPNEKDYTRTTRLESVILGFIHNKAELRALKQELVRSNTRNVYMTDTDDQAVASNREIQRIAKAIERRRIELGKTSGFERLYARVTRLYFGGMARHLASLRTILRPGARLAYVVGDQASYLRVMIRTGAILADLARGLGYEVESIDLFRTRRATATRATLREEVVILRWPRSVHANGSGPPRLKRVSSGRSGAIDKRPAAHVPPERG